MRKLLGLGLVASLLLNGFLLLDRRRETTPPIRTRVVERQVESEPRPEPPSFAPERGGASEGKPPIPVLSNATPPDPVRVSLIVSQAYAEPGAEITVTCTVASGSPQANHWVGLFTPVAHVTNHSGYRMVDAAQSSYAIKAPRTPGEYEFRYILGDNRTVIATSNLVRVLGAPPARPLVEIQAGSTVVRCGGEIQARWNVYSGRRTAQDWIGLFAPGAKNEQYAAWKYVTDADQGVLTLQAPEEPGTYELRYLLENGYECAAVSIRITVVP